MMARQCNCRRRCTHLMHGAINPLLLPEELDALAGVLVKVAETPYMDVEGSVR